MIDGAHDELGTIDVVERASRLRSTDLQVLDRLTVVLGRDEIVQNRSVGDLAGQLHHLHSRFELVFVLCFVNLKFDQLYPSHLKLN